MSKKRLGLLLAAILVLAMALGACGDKTSSVSVDESYNVVSEAIGKANNSNQMSFDMDLDYTTTVQKEKTVVQMTGPIKFIQDGESFQYYAQQKMNSNGTKANTTMYYSDGYVYITEEGKKIKRKMPPSEMLATQTNSLTMFEKEYIKSVSSKNVKGDTEYTFTIDGNGLKKIAGNDSNSAAALEGVTEDDMTFEDATLVIVVDSNGRVISEDVKMSYEIKIAGQTAKIKLTLNVTNIKTDGVTIDYPTDLDAYEEAYA